MNIIRNEHGVYHVRKKVPKALEKAVAQVTDAAKSRAAWLKRTRGTKDLKDAKVLAKPVLMELDRTLAKAAALNEERPLRTTLSARKIDRITAAGYGADPLVKPVGFPASQRRGEEGRLNVQIC